MTSHPTSLNSEARAQLSERLEFLGKTSIAHALHAEMEGRTADVVRHDRAARGYVELHFLLESLESELCRVVRRGKL